MESMRIMGEITCQLSENGVKPGILYCSEPEAYRLDEWTASGAVITAVATIALALFAVLAWKSAQKQLRQMEADSAAAEKRFAKQLLENRNSELRKAMEESLFDYMSAHADIVAASTGEGMLIGMAQAQVKKANIRFRMVWELPGMGGELTNFDTVMVMLATARLDELDWPMGSPLRNRGAESAVINGFQTLSAHVSDLFSRRIDPIQFRTALDADSRALLQQNESILVPAYVQHMKDRGLFK